MGLRPGAKPAGQYVLPPAERGFRRVINIDLDDPRFDPVFQYAVETAPDRPVQEGIRDLLLQAISVDPVNATVRVARAQALKEARDRLSKMMWELFRRAESEMKSEPAGSEPSGVSAGNTITIDGSSKAA